MLTKTQVRIPCKEGVPFDPFEVVNLTIESKKQNKTKKNIFFSFDLMTQFTVMNYHWIYTE